MLPKYIFAQKFTKRGIRLPKNRIAEKGYVPINRHYTPHSPLAPEKWSIEDEKKFPYHEYQFFSYNKLHGMSRCRACNAIIMTEAFRKEHLELCGCAKKIVAATKLLAKDPICVVCGLTTNKKKWGVPLCPFQSCINRYMEVAEHMFFREALRLTERLCVTSLCK